MMKSTAVVAEKAAMIVFCLYLIRPMMCPTLNIRTEMDEISENPVITNLSSRI